MHSWAASGLSFLSGAPDGDEVRAASVGSNSQRIDKLPESSKRPELRFNYGSVEMTLAVIYAATEGDKRRKAFRARINYFQRAKVLDDDVEAGKRKQNAYSIVQIERWLACQELTELGARQR